MMRAVNLKNALKTLGYEVIQYSKHYNSRSGFMRKDGKLYYFRYEDLRWTPTLLVRTADENIKRNGKYMDFRGGQNTYPEKELNCLGYYIVEPRQNCDG